MTTISLRIYKAITIYKSQGITVGPGKLWEHFVVWLPIGRQRKNPGTEIVAFSTTSNITTLSIRNMLHEIDIMSLFKTGKGKVFDERKNFDILLANY